MKDAASDEDIPLWKIRLQLTKPVTWVPLVWGVACGAAASGNFHWWNPLTIGQVRSSRARAMAGGALGPRPPPLALHVSAASARCLLYTSPSPRDS